MSYSFGIFPFRMAYRQNSHMRTQSQTISRANIADEYSATTENSETVGVALADPLRAAEIGPQKRTRTPLAMRPFALALILLRAQPDVCARVWAVQDEAAETEEASAPF